ncbi:MAG: hypothetical protein J0H92_20780 [Sphingobacteriales bacterium]|nr:hypothetical protein [Sphingobacteriales bacterium]OJW31885.1 MAG: hypothetical protein BGO54_15735 [Sphingobacteriales bacterium 46-32]
MIKQFSENFRKGFWTALYEYLIVTLPVAIYVMLEAIHKKSWIVFITTPEWSIATIFLAFISISRYRSSLEKSGGRIFEPIFGLISILSLILIVGSTINAYLSLEEETISAIVIRIVLFIVSSMKFLVLITGSKLLQQSK